MFPRSLDITTITGKNVIGLTTSWQTQNGLLNAIHVAVVNTDNEILVFWRSPAHDWQAVKVSTKIDIKIIGELADN